MARALQRMAAQGGVLAPLADARSYGVFARGDRRRSPLVRIGAGDVRDLVSAGAIVSAPCGGYVLTEAGRARAARSAAAPGEAYAAQHGAIVDRAVMDEAGAVGKARGYDGERTLRRLAQMRDGLGRPWLSEAELAAAARLKADWERGQVGLVRGSDWSAPPKGAARRGAGFDGALAAHCDARRRAGEALLSLAAPLRAVVERVVLREEGLETLERLEAWPARSGKLALKLALAQLAER